MTVPVHIGDAALYQGDCLAVLSNLPDQSVQCCVTSPPYFGLRDYQTAAWEGGREDCQHDVQRWEGPKQTQGAQSGHAAKRDRLTRHVCECGAVRVDRQIGLEPTPDEYVAKLVEVFRQVRRVLKDDGVCWVNLGDSYANDGKWGGSSSGKHVTALHGNTGIGRGKQSTGLKPKDLIGIPWAVAFALQADGWYLRQDIIWAKPNPMPESVTDRCTKAHEYLFLLTKSARYYWDAEAMKEAALQPVGIPVPVAQHKQAALGTNQAGTLGTNQGAATRNRRSVWSIATTPFKSAHFAVMPPKLVEACILAGSRLGDTVLDPFSGSGTVGGVATGHGRRYLGIELSPDYLALSVDRLRAAQRQPDLFHEAGKAEASSDLEDKHSHN
jgi:DNA modification methylase